MYNGGIFSGLQSLLALYIGGTPSQMTGTRPPSCLQLDNCLYIFYERFCELSLNLSDKNYVFTCGKINFK